MEIKTILISFGIFVVLGFLGAVLVLWLYLKISEWRFMRKFKRGELK